MVQVVFPHLKVYDFLSLGENMYFIFALISLSTFAHTLSHYPDAPLEIIKVGHPTLRLTAESVSTQEIESEEFQKLIDDLIITMKDASGVGLAAPQVNISKRLFVMKPSMFKKAEAIINPVVEYLVDYGTKISTEGCLSIPGKQFKVERYKKLHIHYQDRKGDDRFEKASGFRAVVIQHEYDHLNGNLISDIFLKSLNLEDDFEFVVPRM